MIEITEVPGGWKARGAKKGAGGSRTPVEAPDSLHSTAYARVLDLLSEGEIAGLVNGLQSIYIGKTPLQNSDGSYNFSGISADFRSGTQFQSYIPGFPATENSVGVGTELVYNQPWVNTSTNLQLSAVRVMLGVNGLAQVNTENGDTNGYRVEYAIDLRTDNGAWEEVVRSAFDGKTTSEYRRSHRIDLPVATQSWQVRVRRLTPQANSQTITDATIIDSYTEIIDGKLRYPMSALAGLQIDASQFNSVPTRSYHIYGRIIRVPSNYDPATRTYTGIWDGLFKSAYSNNPAWVFYDIVTNDRYGLGRLIPAQWMQKWTLYTIGRYCDEFIPDGKGGTEPRFTCNAYMQTPGDALRVLQDLASVFRGITYWAAGNAVAVADMPRDKSYTYTQANSISGAFEYTGSRRKDRPSIAIVSYNDPQDMFRQKTVSVPDEDLMRRYGIKPIEISSFGCTSEAQAIRVGKWALLTGSKETRGVSFTAGLDATICTPGQVIEVADNAFAGRRIGGRLRSATLSSVTLDSAVQVQYGDTISVVMPDGTVQSRKIAKGVGLLLTADDTTRTLDMTTITADAISVPGSATTITLEQNFSQVPLPEAVWSIESGTLRTQLFNVISVTEASTPGQFHITGLQHEPGKFAAIDYGTKLDERPITVVPPSVQPPPSNVRMSDYSILYMGVASQMGVIEWDAPEVQADHYEIEWRRDNSNWVRTPHVSATRVELPNIYSGKYTARVRAVNSLNSPSLWVYSTPVDLTGTIPAPPAVTHFTTTAIVFGIAMEWGFPNVANIIERTEIWYGTNNNLDAATKLTDLAYPQNDYTMQGLAAGVEFWFWARLVDKNGLPGPWFGPVRGTSSSDASAIASYIAGQIDATWLADDVKAPIEEIPLLKQQIEVNATAITDERTLREQADSSLAQTISTVSAKTDANTAAVQDEATARTDADSALGQRIDTVQAATGSNLALIQNETTARTDADSALGQRIDTVQASVGSNTALIQGVDSASVDRDNALGQRVDTVQATAGQGLALSQTVQTALAKTNGDLAAMYTIKTQITSDGVPYMAGIGVGVENSEGVITSQILLSAQRVAVINEVNGSTTVPFVIQNGQTILASAFIGNATIGSGKIVEWLESDATNNLGQRVFRLNMRNGQVEFNGTNSFEGRLVINNKLIQGFNPSGGLKFRLGSW